jgi:broad specificity phosphatase PhoE
MADINIYWVRHGYSCANYVRDNEKTFFNPFPHTNVKDPRLHAKGVEEAVKLAEIFKSKNIMFDLICSSQLYRAIQTAQTISDELGIKDKVLVLPQICEEAWKNIKSINTDDNIPYRYLYNKLDLVDKLDGLDYSQYYPNYEYFIKYVIAYLRSYLIYKYKEEKVFNIVIVTHSHFLKHIFGEKLENCEYILQRNVKSYRDKIYEIMSTYKISFEEAKEKLHKDKKYKIYSYIKPGIKTDIKINEVGGCKDLDPVLHKALTNKYLQESKFKKSKTKSKSKSKSKSKTKTKKSKTKSKTKTKKSKTKTKKSKTKH